MRLGVDLIIFKLDLLSCLGKRMKWYMSENVNPYLHLQNMWLYHLLIDRHPGEEVTGTHHYSSLCYITRVSQ